MGDKFETLRRPGRLDSWGCRRVRRRGGDNRLNEPRKRWMNRVGRPIRRIYPLPPVVAAGVGDGRAQRFSAGGDAGTVYLRPEPRGTA
jgi:hypothetical protein